MKNLFLYASVLAGMMMFSCSSDEPQQEPMPEVPEVPETPDVPDEPEVKCKEYKPIDLSVAEKNVADKYAKFGWRIFSKLNRSNENYIVSPLSASFALSLLLNGANGATYDEIAKVLVFDDIDIEAVNTLNAKTIKHLVDVDNTTTVSIANSFWSSCGIKPLPLYVDVLKESYDAEFYDVEPCDMVELFNKWCSEKTNGLINKMIDEPYDMVLANALYFNGRWAATFDKKDTREDFFTCADGTRSKAMFMHRHFNHLGYACNDIYETVVLPYGNGAYSFKAYLPVEGKTIDDCISRMLNDMSMTDYYSEVIADFSMPRFESTLGVNLTSTLVEMGMKTAFSDACDLSKMCREKTIVTDVFQKCVIKVEERGSVAAAVTALIIGATCAPSTKEIKIDLNRPFLYTISELSTGAILFIGTVNKL